MSFIFKYKWVILALILGLAAYGILTTLTIPKQEMPTLKTPYLIVQVDSDAPDTIDKINAETAQWIQEDMVLSVELTHLQTTLLLTAELPYDTSDPKQIKDAMLVDLESALPGALITDQLTIASYDMIFALTGDEEVLNTRANELVEQLRTLPTETVTLQSPLESGIHINLIPDALVGYNLTLTQVLGVLDSHTQTLNTGSLESVQDLIVSPGVSLKDIADVSQTVTPDTQFNAKRALLVSANFNEDIDYTTYIENINGILEDIESKGGVTITPIVYTPNDVADLYNDLLLSIGLATVIVFLVTLIGLGFRQSLVVIAIVPSVVFITIIGINLLGYQLHKLTIIGLILSIGMMVDNAIVLTEGTKFFLEKGLSKKAAAKAAVHKNKWPILTATITTLLAFSSVAFIPGFIGDLVRSMPITVIIAISLSYILSLVLTPILAIFFVKKGHKKQGKRQGLKRSLERAFRHPKKIMGAVILIVAGVIYASITTSDIDLFPSEDKLDFYISVSSPSEDILKEMSNTIEDILDDASIISGVTRAKNTDLPRFHMSVKNLPYDQFTLRYYINTNGSKQDMHALIDRLKAIDSSGANVYVDSLHLSPPDAPLEVTITGDNAQIKANELVALLKDNPLIESINSVTDQASDILTVTAKDTGFEAYTPVVNGLLAFQYPMNASLTVGLLQSDALNDVTLIDGVPLEDVFDFSMNTYQISNHYYNAEPSAYLSITPTENRNIGQIEALINSEIDDSLSVTYSGENALFLTLSNALIISGSLAVICMFLLLLFQFKRFGNTLIILFTVPLSFTGSLIGMMVFQYDITVSSLIGMVSLLGVTVNIGILLIEEIEKELKNQSIKNACITATSNRFRPIILTSATTILGLIPLYITGGNFFRPLAITFIFGMFFATIISLFVIPIMIYLSRKPKM